MTVPITARAPIEFTPPTLPAGLQGEDDKGEKKFKVLVRVPTMLERDTYNAALIRGGVVNYSRSQIRDLSLAGIQEVYKSEGPEAVEEKVALLEEFWIVQDEEARVQDQQMRVLFELHEAAKEKDPEGAPDPEEVKKALEQIVPTKVMDRARKVDAMAINQDVLSRYDKLKNALASLTEQDARRARMNAEIYVLGWKGLEHDAEGPTTGRTGLHPHEAEYLRQQIGEEGFLELSNFITALMGIDEDEEKNLASLLENMSAPTGLTADTSKASSEDGNSTTGPSTETPANGSRKTTASSSGSTTSSGTRLAGRKPGRTQKRSSTSR